MAKSVLTASNVTSPAAGTTVYVPVSVCRINTQTTEAGRGARFRQAGFLHNLWVRITANATTATTTVKTRKNATTDGVNTFTIGAGVTGTFEDTTHTDTVTSGDDWAYQMIVGTGGTITVAIMSIIFNCTTNTVTKYNLNMNAISATSATYFPLTSDFTAGDATEANVKIRIRQDGTFKHFYTNVISNSKAANTPIRFRKNGADAALLMTIGSSATGIFEDTTNTVSVTAGDDVDVAIVPTAAGSTQPLLVQCSLETTDEFGFITNSRGVAVTQAEPLVNWYAFGGGLTQNTTEAFAQLKCRYDLVLSNLTVHIPINTITGTSTLKLRINATDGTGICSIGSSATGYFTDTTNWDACLNNDLVNYQLETPAVGGTPTLTIRSMSITVEPRALLNIALTVPTETVTASDTRTRLAAKNRATTDTAITVGETRARLSTKLRALAAQTTTIGAGTSARLGTKQRPIATQTTSLSDSVARVKTTGANNVVRAVPTQTITLGAGTAARLSVKLRPIATQTTSLSDSVARVKTPFGGGPADMSQVAAKTYGNKFITKV